MSFMNVSLTNLVTDAFQNCGRLTTISIYYNPLTKIPASFASTCINVTSFMAYGNQIREIDVNAFKGLDYLQYLYLSDNKISCLPAGVFQNTPIAQTIDLRNNLITILDPKTFTNLPNLNSITLSSNKIIALPAFDFTLTGMTMGLNFMVDTNPIQAIHKDFIIKFFTSRSHSIGSNMISLYNYGNENITTCIPKDSIYGVMRYKKIFDN
jgi:Leucine-rich repeat (LRR) protein